MYLAFVPFATSVTRTEFATLESSDGDVTIAVEPFWPACWRVAKDDVSAPRYPATTAVSAVAVPNVTSYEVAVVAVRTSRKCRTPVPFARSSRTVHPGAVIAAPALRTATEATIRSPSPTPVGLARNVDVAPLEFRFDDPRNTIFERVRLTGAVGADS